MDMNLSNPWEVVEDRGAWRAAVNGVAKSQIRLSDLKATIWYNNVKINSMLILSMKGLNSVVEHHFCKINCIVYFCLQ